MARTAPVAASSTTTAPCAHAGRLARPVQQSGQSRLGHGLDAGVERGAQHRVVAVWQGLLGLRGRPVGEPAGGDRRRGRESDLCLGLALLRRGDGAGRDHCCQHLLRTGRRGGRIDTRVEARGRTRQPGQHRRLPQRHVPGGDAEIHPRRRVHAPGARPQVDPVQIDLQNLPLAEMLLQPQRQQQFLHLAAERAGVGEEQVLGHLLGDGGAALHHAAGRADRSRRRGRGRSGRCRGVPSSGGPPPRRRRRAGRAACPPGGAVRRPRRRSGRRRGRCGLPGQAGAAGGVERGIRARQVAREPQHEHGHRQGAPDRGHDRPAEHPDDAAAADGGCGRRRQWRGCGGAARRCGRRWRRRAPGDDGGGAGGRRASDGRGGARRTGHQGIGLAPEEEARRRNVAHRPVRGEALIAVVPAGGKVGLARPLRGKQPGPARIDGDQRTFAELGNP